MSKISVIGLLVAACWGLVAQAQPAVEINGATPINDYISLGEFETAGGLEGWNSAGGGANPKLAVANGVLKITTTSGDPWFYRLGLKEIPADFTTVEVRLKKVSGSSAGWEVFYGTTAAGQGGFSGARRAGYDISDDNEYHLLQFDFSGVLDGASLSDIRIDSGQAAGVVAEVDYVRVGKVSPDSDGDGLPDTVETKTGVYVSPRDTGTDPAKADTDGDKVNDGAEVAFGTDPNNAAQFPVTSIKYLTSDNTYVVTEAITANTAIVNNGKASSFTISPALPAGLKLDPATGAISGTPTAVAAAADHTVTANLTGGGTTTTTLRVEVRSPYVDFTVDRFSFRPNQGIAPITPQVHGPAPKSYTIKPALPDGLALDPLTGEISGTATAYSIATDYTVTAAYAGFEDATAAISISVLEEPLLTVDPTDPLIAYQSLGEFDDDADVTRVNIKNNVGTPSAVSGSLVLETTGGDPYFGYTFTLDHDYRLFEFRLKVTAGSASPMRFYWAEDAEGRRNLSELTAYSTSEINADGAFHVYRVDFSKAIEGRLIVMRIDPGDNAGSAMEVDYIRVGGFDAPLTASLKADGSVRLSWPAAATGYSLQSTTSLPGGWVADNAAPSTEGAEKVVVVGASGAARFWRLVK